MLSKKVWIFGLALGAVLTPSLVNSYTLTTNTLIEDFSTITYSDFSASTGLWNIVDQVAQAAVYADAAATRPLNFGDGSDGIIDTRGGYTFDTSNHPNGFNFVYVTILGGEITVTGSNPLIIRSLGHVNISPTISVKGGDGSNGVTGVNGSLAGPDGGTPLTCPYYGGRGGAADSSLGYDAPDATQYNGQPETPTGGTGDTGGIAAVAANASSTGPSGDFDTGAGFVCGTTGAGGGGHSDGASAFATGASGGAGGGRLRILAVGSVNIANTDARGGEGGLGVTDGTACSGHAAGGAGGSVWIQTLHSLLSNTPDVTGGNGGTGGGCGLGPGASIGGLARGDSASVNDRPAWAGGAGNYDTADALANTNYIIQSKAYDLGTLNVYFTEPPSVSIVENGGSVSVKWAASKDGQTFTEFRDEIRDFNNSNYRYVKFKITITTAAVAGPSPQVSNVRLNYSDIGAKDIDLNLSTGFGCGSVSAQGPTSGLKLFSFWFIVFLSLYGAVRKTRRGNTTLFPA